MDVTDTVLRLTGQRSVRSIASRVEVPPASLNRQLRENNLPLPTVVAICRAYGVSIVEMLVALDYLEPHDVAATGSSRDLSSYSDLELAGEIYRRTADSASRLRSA